MKTIAITIDEDMLARLDRFTAGSEDAGSRSEVIREAIAQYLVREEREVEEAREKEIFKRHRSRLARQATALVKEQAKV